MSSLAGRLAQRTLELCRVASVTGSEATLCDEIERFCSRRFDGAVRRVADNLVAGRLDDPRPTLALVGHLDTVPGRAGDGGARIEGNRVVGLGSSDMKSGLAVMMELAEDLALDALPYNLVLVFYAREEGPFADNGLGVLLPAVPELSRTRLAFILEPTQNELQVGCLGTLHARVTFRGKRAHSARPWEGENAIHKAAGLLTELSESAPRPVLIEGFEFIEVVSATLASGGQTRNVVPDRFELNLNYRFAPDKTVAEAEGVLQTLVAGRADVELVDRAPAGRACNANPLFRRFRELTGAPAGAKQAWTDVARLTSMGIDAVNFGPGLTSQAHQAGEYVPVENLASSYEMLRQFLEARP